MKEKNPYQGDSTTSAAARTASPYAYRRAVRPLTGRTSRNQVSHAAASTATTPVAARSCPPFVGTANATTVENASMRKGSARMTVGS